MGEAWEALLRGEHALAEKIARRATLGSEMNARMWCDLGRILWQCRSADDAEAALRRAIALAPTYGEAFAELAALQAAHGKWVAAERLQRRAVELLPNDERAQQDLRSYGAMLPAAGAGTADAEADAPAPRPMARTDRHDWRAVADELAARGMARLPGLLTPAECAALRALWDQPCFEHAVPCDDDRGRLEYRFFARPLPALVLELREDVYVRLHSISNEWQRRLHRNVQFPSTLARFLGRCAEAGQHRSTPILLRYPPSGWNAPHRDVAGRVVFPFQLAVTLGPDPAAVAGGALRLLDVHGNRVRREHTLASEPGDGVVFCTQERLVAIAGVDAVQPVQHGVATCTAERFALGVPFHDHG
jgi:hypothetical protein